MAKRDKRLKKAIESFEKPQNSLRSPLKTPTKCCEIGGYSKSSIESYKEEIEKHFEKLDKDILEDDEITAKYHIKEIDKSLIAGIEKRMSFFSENSKETHENKELVDKYRKKLEEYKKKLSMDKG